MAERRVTPASGPLQGAELELAVRVLTESQLRIYKRFRRADPITSIAAGEGISPTAARHSIVRAERRLDYTPSFAAKRKTPYQRTGAPRGRPRGGTRPDVTPPPEDDFWTIANRLRNRAALAQDPVDATWYEDQAAVFETWLDLGFRNFRQLPPRWFDERLRRLAAERRRGTRADDHDDPQRTHRYDEDFVHRALNDDGVSYGLESSLSTKLPDW